MITSTHLRIKKISAQLLVKDMNSSIDFYSKKLEFEIDFCYEDFYSGISKDGFSIHLKKGKPSTGEREQRRNNQDLDVVFSVEAIEDIYEEFKSKSIEFIQPLRKMDYGKEFYITDPDGYILGFLEEV